MTPYHRPYTLEKALALRAAGPICVAAGCTDLYPLTQSKTLAGPVLDITAIDALHGITVSDSGYRIGAATSWSDILHADLPCAFKALQLAASEVGSIQIQNTASVAGNLCTASPAGDGIPCLMVLDATVELASLTGLRSLPLQDFLTGPRQTAIGADEIVTAIQIPASAVAGNSHFLKLGARKYLVISIAMVAARLECDGDTITGAAVSVGACGPVATRLFTLESALIGQPIVQASKRVTRDLIAPHLSPIDDIRADRDYRLTAATTLVERAVSELVSSHQRADA